MAYNVFTRTWWKPATTAGWPSGREPSPGRKSRRGHPQRVSFEAAREYCQAWNATHNPGRWSRKAEFEEA